MWDTCFETDGKRNGNYIFCTVNAIGDCPYCDKHGVCHIANPIEECDDFGAFWGSWDAYDDADSVDPNAPKDFAEDEIWWARENLGYPG